MSLEPFPNIDKQTASECLSGCCFEDPKFDNVLAGLAGLRKAVIVMIGFIRVK